MNIINWNKPKKVDRGGGFDGGPDGGYVPQMSDKDMQQWKGKHINKGKDNERIELRKTFESCNEYAQVLIVIGNKLEPKTNSRLYRDPSKKVGNVRMSSNGSIEMTFDEYQEMTEAVNEAKQLLNGS